jgi:hypothetical protein
VFAPVSSDPEFAGDFDGRHGFHPALLCQAGASEGYALQAFEEEQFGRKGDGRPEEWAGGEPDGGIEFGRDTFGAHEVRFLFWLSEKRHFRKETQLS